MDVSMNAMERERDPDASMLEKARVDHLSAHEILDSRGFPTIEVTISAAGVSATASVPCGKSTGRFKALERRDGDARRFGGKGVLGAVAAVNYEIAARPVGRPLGVPSERLAKYIQLLRIEAQLGDRAAFAGLDVFRPAA